MDDAPAQIDSKKDASATHLAAKIARILMAAGAVVVLCLILIPGIAIWQFNRPPFPLERLEQLDRTMTADDVRRILGTPSNSWIEEDAEGRPYEEWVYKRRNSWPMVYIYFDRDGKFSDSEYDY